MPNEIDELIDYELFPDGSEVVEQGAIDTVPAVIDTTDDEDDIYGLNSKEFIKNSDTKDLISDILSKNGISDPTKISIADEQGNIKEVNFHDLSLDEQRDILLGTQPESTPTLEDAEIEDLNFLRTNGKRLSQIVDEAKQQALDEYRQSQGETFNVDSFSDDELFQSDLKIRFEDLTDEEIHSELEKEKLNPELFQKKINKIRQEYKDLEIESKKQQDLEIQAKQQESYDTFVNSMIDTAKDFSDINEFDLGDEDKNEILDYILEVDEQGQSQIAKALNDPKQLFELAWYAVKGKEAFAAINDYYKKEIENIKKSVPQAAPTVAYRSVASNGIHNNGKVLSLDDLM